VFPFEKGYKGELTNREKQERILIPLKAKLQAVKDNPGCFELSPEFAIFNGNCDECVPFCGAVCCEIYEFVKLTEEEAKSGRYKFIEEDPTCDCAQCTDMRALDMRYSLPKNPDYSCVYLDENKRCSIYEIRPQTCRDYNCKGKLIPLSLDM
jgi:Fe-S-cluster containining protein